MLTLHKASNHWCVTFLTVAINLSFSHFLFCFRQDAFNTEFNLLSQFFSISIFDNDLPLFLTVLNISGFLNISLTIFPSLSTRFYDKCDDFDFHIVSFPFLFSNISSGPYRVYISQLVTYARCCSHHNDFRATSHSCIKRERLLIITHSSYFKNIMHYYFA